MRACGQRFAFGPGRVTVNRGGGDAVKAQKAGEGRAVATQLQQVVDRFVSPGLAAPVRLLPLGEVPLDAAVRTSVQRRQLLMDALPGSPEAVALAAAAARLLPP